MHVPLVTLLVCPPPVACAVFVNGALMGQAAPKEPLPMPLSATGDYFFTLMPLSGSYLPITRQLCLQNGRPKLPLSPDVKLYGWPRSLYELELTLPHLAAPESAPYPYLLTRLSLPNGRSAALYADHGLCLVVEEGWRVLYGARLSRAAQGKLVQQNGLLFALTEKTDEEDALLVALTPDFQEAFRLSGDSVFLTPNAAQSIKQLPTLLGHQRRERYLLQERPPRREPPVFGFFTREFSPPTEKAQIARALLDAVQHGFFTEARQYLTADLSAQLSDEDLRDFFFGCSGVRNHPQGELSSPPPDTALLHLVFPEKGGLFCLRPFAFRFLNGAVDDVSDPEEPDGT